MQLPDTILPGDNFLILVWSDGKAEAVCMDCVTRIFLPLAAKLK